MRKRWFTLWISLNISAHLITGGSITGCAWFQKTTLESTADNPSPYLGDAVLFRAEQSVTTGYHLLDEFVLWEKKFRPLIKNTNVKHAADNVRKNAKRWIKSAENFRDAYKKNPTDANKTTLNED